MDNEVNKIINEKIADILEEEIEKFSDKERTILLYREPAAYFQRWELVLRVAERLEEYFKRDKFLHLQRIRRYLLRFPNLKYDNLTNFLLVESLLTNPSDALAALNRILQSTSVSSSNLVLMSGLELTKSIKFGEGIAVHPENDLPEYASFFLDINGHIKEYSIFSPHQRFYIEIPFESPLSMENKEQAVDWIKFRVEIENKVNDVINTLVLCSGKAFSEILSFDCFTDRQMNTLSGHGGFSLPYQQVNPPYYYEGFPLEPDILTDYYKKITSLDSKSYKKVSSLCSMLNNARSFNDARRQALELTNILETILGGRTPARIVQNRVAWLLGKNPKDRETIQTDVESLYKLRNSFAHGDHEEDNLVAKYSEELQKCQEYSTKVVRWYLRNYKKINKGSLKKLDLGFDIEKLFPY